jgi:hypothetical protein
MKRAAAVLLVVVVMASCADPPVPGSGELDEEEPASITVSATYDFSSCCYVEGFIPFVRIVGSGEDIQREFEVPNEGRVTEVVLEVPRGGEYTLSSWVEPCAGNCGATDPPTDRCSTDITVPDGDDLEVDLLIRTGDPCQLSVEGQ